MRHPFDGVEAAKAAPARQTRRSMLSQMFAAGAGLLGLNRLAQAQELSTEAVGEEGGRVLSTRALGEEGGVTKLNREGGMTRAAIPSETGGVRPMPQSVDLTDRQMEDAWAKLGDADAAKWNEAFDRLYSAKKVVPFLKDKLKVDGSAVDEKQIGQLVQDLDADDFATREKASTALAQMGPEVAPAIQAHVGKAGSLEVRRRLEMILMKLGESAKVLQVKRGLQILVAIPNQEARGVVEGLSKQTPETWLTAEAKTALKPMLLKPVDRIDNIVAPNGRIIELPAKRIEVQPK